MHKLFSSELKVINIGLPAFKQALDDAHVPAVQLDWKPPMNVDAALMERVSSMLPEIEKANAKAVEMIQSGMPHLVGMGQALDVVPGMKHEPDAARRPADRLGAHVRSHARRRDRRSAL